MESAPSTKTLVTHSLLGNFQDVYDGITSNNLKLETSSAVKILVSACNACHKNASLIKVPALVQTVKCLLKFIQVPSDELFEQYIRSAYFILKYLIDKKDCDAILQLEELPLPNFMPLDITPQQHSIYLSMCKSIYNLVVGMDKAQVKHALNLCFLVVKIFKRLSKKDLWFDFVYNCIPALTALKAPEEGLVEFYKNLTQSTEPIDNAKVYILIVKNVSVLYTHLLENENFKMATECYKSTVAHLSKVKGSEYGLLNDIMSVVECFNPNNLASMTRQVFIGADSDLKKYLKLHNSTAKLQAVCDFIASVSLTASNLYKKTNLWTQKLEVHLNCYRFLYDISQLLAKTPASCPCKCATATNLYGSVRLLNIISRLGRLNQNEISCGKDMSIYLDKFSQCVMTLRANKCEKWQKQWADLGVVLYNYGLHFRHKETRMCLTYLEKFVGNYCVLEGCQGQTKIIDRSHLKWALNVMGDIHYENQDFERCLLVVALSIALFESRKSDMVRWIKAKAECRANQELQEVTLASFCHRYRKDPIFLKAGIKLDTEQKIDLLVYELRQYHSMWKSKIPMAAAFRELAQLATPQLTAEIFIEIWGDGEMAVHDNLPTLLRATIRRLEPEKIAKKKLLLSHLHFLQHKYRVKETVLKHCDEMETTMSIGKVSHNAVAALAPPDPDDECDLVSSYESLKLSRYVAMMKEVNESLGLLHQWVSKDGTDASDVDRLLKLLTNIGHEYGLHGHTAKSLQAWELALRVATSADNALYKVQATGFIIELADVRKAHVRNLVTDAERDIGTLRINRNFSELITYYLCKADAYLYVDVAVARASFQQASLLQEEHLCGHMIEARIHLLRHKFALLPCRLPVEGHEEYRLVEIHHANHSANAHYTQAQCLSSYDMRVLFDVYENLVRWYHDLQLPREVRCYAKDTIIVAQKMILPFRTMSLIYYLAHADVATRRLDDGRVKIKDFSDMLCLGEPVVNRVVTQSKEQVIDILVEDFGEMMLDVPRRVAQSTCTGSPGFAPESFESPEFLTHAEDCECLCCMTVEYQEFVVKVTFLKALLSQYENNVHIAKDFFYGCLKVCECLKRREASYAKKTRTRISEGLVPNVRDKLVEVYCVSLKEYGNFLMRNKRLADAEKINKRLLTKLESSCSQAQFVHLYRKVLFQTVNIRSLRDERPPTSRTLSPVESRDASVKTPPSRQNTVTVSPNNWTTTPVKTKILPRSIKFNLCDDEDPKPRKRAQLDVPFLNLGASTPAPSSSKVKIYTNGSMKKTKSVPVMPTPFKEPVAANPSTADKRANANLASRTKLLTERLRDSSRKGGSTKKSESVKRDVKKGSVKQNLLQQLDEADAQPKEVRRSARNVK